MPHFREVFGDLDSLIDMQPDLLGPRLVPWLHSQQQNELLYQGILRTSLLDRNYPEVPHAKARQIELSLAEAWAWLEREGALIPAEGTNGTNGYRRFGRAAEKYKSGAPFQTGPSLRSLSGLLHPKVKDRAILDFAAGRYDDVIYNAFKEVEIRISEAIPGHEFGTALAKAAFDINKGPYTDHSLPTGEKNAMRDLFAGAIGVFKNPGSHRRVAIDAAAAIRGVMFASQLHYMIDEAEARLSSTAP